MKVQFFFLTINSFGTFSDKIPLGKLSPEMTCLLLSFGFLLLTFLSYKKRQEEIYTFIFMSLMDFEKNEDTVDCEGMCVESLFQTMKQYHLFKEMSYNEMILFIDGFVSEGKLSKHIEGQKTFISRSSSCHKKSIFNKEEKD